MSKRYGYARVSSKEQAQGYSLENQIVRLKAAGCERVFADIESGYKKGVQRLDFENLMQTIVNGDEVIVINLDRLSRNEAFSFGVFDEFEELRVKLTSLDQPYLDLNNPDGRVIAGYSVLEARAYSARLSRKVKQGHQHHRDRNAAYFSPFGYRKVGERFELDDTPFLCLIADQSQLSKADVGRDLVTIFLSCNSLRRSLRIINEKYGIFSHSGKGKGNKQARGGLHFGSAGFASWLNNPVLRGHLCYGRASKQRQSHKHSWDIRHNTHPDHRLVSEKEYKQIEEILDWNSKHGGYQFKSDIIHPLSGLIYCGECRGRCRVTHFRLRTDSTIKKYSYQCNNYQIKSCTQKQSIREFVIEQEVIKELARRAEAVTALANMPLEAVEPPELKELRSKLAVLEQLGYNEAIEEAKSKLRLQIENLIHQLQNVAVVNSGNKELLLEVFRAIDFWQELEADQKQRFYRSLVERVVVRNGKVERVILKV